MKEREAEKQAEEKAKIDAYSKQIVNNSYTFFDIGENDTLKSVLVKMSGEFVVSNQRETGVKYPTIMSNYKFEDLDEKNDDKRKFRNVARNYYRYWRKLAKVERTIDSYGNSVIWLMCNPKSGNSVIKRINFYFSKRDGKLLYYHVIFKDGMIADIAGKFIEKFGSEFYHMAINNNIGLYYWEKDNDCMFIGSDKILYNWNNDTFLVTVYGSNIDAYISTIMPIHEMKIKEDAVRKSQEIDKF